MGKPICTASLAERRVLWAFEIAAGNCKGFDCELGTVDRGTRAGCQHWQRAAMWRSAPSKPNFARLLNLMVFP